MHWKPRLGSVTSSFLVSFEEVCSPPLPPSPAVLGRWQIPGMVVHLPGHCYWFRQVTQADPTRVFLRTSAGKAILFWIDLSPFLAVGFKSLIAHLFYAPFCIILIEVLKKKQWEATVEIHGDSE